MKISTLIAVDPDILGGQIVSTGTRVQVESLFDHLEARVSLDKFLDDFLTVTKAQAIALLDLDNKLLPSKNIDQLYVAAT
jgi:uncharacterized protein (DUF433 family)